jgi:hypothetical protein
VLCGGLLATLLVAAPSALAQTDPATRADSLQETPDSAAPSDTVDEQIDEDRRARGE